MLDYQTPKVMGILNITPDSFYDGNRYTNEASVLKRVEQMLNEGADIIDIGAFSSRPGADFVSYEDERKRLIPFLESIIKHFPKAVLSVDTYRHQIAREVVDYGVQFINDISGGDLDPKMFETIAGLPVDYVMMHMKGIPKNMQDNPVYQNVVKDILNIFKKKIIALKKLNFNRIILDPGFGFGKTLAQNYEILYQLEKIAGLGFPVLAGISRKSMLYKPLNITPDDALCASVSVHTIALLKGAKIIRVHDVKPAVESLEIVQLLKKSS